MRVDPWEAQIMRDCQHGTDMPGGGTTGSVCRKQNSCRAEGRCYFVHGVELYLELHNGLMPGQGRMAKPVGKLPQELPRITWHPGYDGFVWAL